MRADQWLLAHGLASSRSQAQRLIAAGVQWRVGPGAWQQVAKNGDMLPAQAQVKLLDTAEARYVSRGGLKLEGALRHSGVNVSGWRCLDVGQSTGGFTDCLLQHGAAQVVGLDVGYGQLHPRLRAESRVVCLERVNARELAPQDARIPDADLGFDAIVADLSFISQTLVWPAVLPLLRPAGVLLSLVKPQFELQPEDIGKGGLVKEAASYARVQARMREAFASWQMDVQGYWESVVTGGDGNREFWIQASRKPA
ncbi:MAG: TlyA family RNA methyltransferase [Limnohabitans sp.]|nr:TlyA family RNA methyltransferase [Limnohabitans sp.]